MKQYSFDVVVVGGGIAGVSAALSAKRQNKSVCLIESTFTLGGLATSGLIAFYLPLCDGEGHQMCFGIAEELLKLSISENKDPIDNPWLKEDSSLEERTKRRYEVQFNPNTFALLLEKQLIKEGVTIMYGCTASRVKKSLKKIKSIIVTSRTESLEVFGKGFVDATGDATLAYYAGVPTETCPAGNILAAWHYVCKEGAYSIKTMGSCDYIYKDKIEGKKFVGIDTLELSNVNIEAHQEILKSLLKEGGESSKYSLATLPSIPQVRMTRRIIGKASLHYEDNDKHFESSVGTYGSFLERGLRYELPAEALYSDKVPNLFVAGRCISAGDVKSWDIIRVIPVCAVSGEAAGRMAAGR